MPIVGTAATCDLRLGDVETILSYVVRRFHYEVQHVEAGEVVGYRPFSTVGAGHDSNHASGTAVDLWPRRYPTGARGGLLDVQVDRVRDIVRSCEGVVRWGGDFTRPSEGHFEIAAEPGNAKVRRLAEKLRHWESQPGLGAGSSG